jgi:hypothetical protein
VGIASDGPMLARYVPPGEEFESPPDLGSRLPQEVGAHVFHGLQHETASPSHADTYARAI